MVTGSLVKRGKVWYAVWHQEGRQRWRSTQETNRKEAKAVLDAIVAPLNAADQARAFREAAEAAYVRIGEATGTSIRLEHMWEMFEEAPERPDAAPVTLEGYKSAWQRFFDWNRKEHPKSATLSDVTPPLASDYAKSLRDGVGSASYNRHIGVLRLIWKTIAKRSGWKDNPWMMVSLRRATHIVKRELTPAELDSLLAAAVDPEFKTLILLGAFTGMRLADCVTLQWCEVDLDRALIMRVPRKTARKAGKLLHIHIHAQLQIALQARRAHAGRAPDVLPKTAAIYRQGRSNLSKRIGRIFKRAGIERLGDKPTGNVHRPTLAGFHSLRHTFVSICRSQNIAMSVVQELVGHSNPAMTRHYTHTGEDAMRSAIESLPMIGESRPAPARECLPDWAKAALAEMTPDNWSEVRDAMLADPPPSAPPTA